MDIGSFLDDVKNKNQYLYAAINNNRVIGFLFGYINKSKNEFEEVAHIIFLYVDKDYSENGVATTLIEEFLKEI